ncbi:MAG: sialidase family protein [Spirochaetota bacterium]|nr:sialidase family protein [Spirochaetota bacterium]
MDASFHIFFVSSGCQSNNNNEIIPPVDTIKPILSSGTIKVSTISETNVKLEWVPAADDQATVLQYLAYYSYANNINSVTEIEQNGIPVGEFESDITSKSINISLERTYYYNVIVKDSAGNKASYNMSADQWTTFKDSIRLEVANFEEYHTPQRQQLAIMGWEDGVHISRDGLHLYCTYIPLDFLSVILADPPLMPEEFAPYRRGPSFGMDFQTNPLSDYEWIHSDILYTNRGSTSEPFEKWTLSNMARAFYSEEAPFALFDGSGIEIMTFTSNDTPDPYKQDIRIIEDTEYNPTGLGSSISDYVNSVASHEDNPHIERLNSSNLVLFFDSEDRPGGYGYHDIWYSTSSDNGDTWAVPENLSSLNTDVTDHQPHLYKDNAGDWYLYFSFYHTDGKLAIFRAKLMDNNNWDSFGPRDLVISSGNAAGIGDPTLTSNGDISFVVVYDNPEGSSTNRYDADPWILLKKM